MNVMRLIFCGNFEYDACQSELERLFGRYGKVDRVDMKPGFTFIYMDDEHDAEDAIRALDRTEFGRHGRRLRVEWTTKQEHGDKRSGSSRRSSANSRPVKTLFVINFDPINTRMRDLERHFEPYGKVLNVRIRRNFAFIRFESQDDATKALDATNTSKLMDRVISVEYAVRDDDERRNGYRTDMRGRERSQKAEAAIVADLQVLTAGVWRGLALIMAVVRALIPSLNRGEVLIMEELTVLLTRDTVAAVIRQQGEREHKKKLQLRQLAYHTLLQVSCYDMVKCFFRYCNHLCLFMKTQKLKFPGKQCELGKLLILLTVLWITLLAKTILY